MPCPTVRIAADVGGTFIDIVAVDDVTGEIMIASSPSTRPPGRRSGPLARTSRDDLAGRLVGAHDEGSHPLAAFGHHANVRSELPAGRVTLVFTDIEGSTRLLRELGAGAYGEALGEHRRLLRDAYERHGGVEVDTQGDAFFFAFPDAREAVASAEEGREALRSGPIQVRVGVHTGMPHLGPEGYVGHDVHLGARIGAAGHGGQVLLSEAARAAAGIDNDALLDLGEHRLKDIDLPIRILQLGAERFPPLKTISNTNLPHPASSFIGRERETLEIVDLIRERGARLVTLTGPGGSGKTRLAIEVAAELLGDHKAGTFWVELAPIRDPALVTEEIGKTLGAQDGLAEHIRERQMLLVLDNLEQVIDAGRDLADLIEACPNLVIVVDEPRAPPRQGRGRSAGPAARRARRGRALRRASEPPRAGRGRPRPLPRSRRDAARDRAGRRPCEGLVAAPDPRSPLAAPRPVHRRPRRRSAPADSAFDDRLVARPPRRRRAAPIRASGGLRRRRHARSRRSGCGR